MTISASRWPLVVLLLVSALLGDFRNNPAFGAYVGGLLDDARFLWPRDGRGDDAAHPPIHPTKSVDPASLQQDERKVRLSLANEFPTCF